MWCMYVLVAIQIIIESLPISSSGHGYLIEQMWQSCDRISPEFRGLVYECAHGPTIVIVILFFFHRWFWMITSWRRCWPIMAKIVGLVCAADIVTFVWYVIFAYAPWLRIPLSVGFCVTALVLYSLRYCPRRKVRPWSWRSALIIGCVQGVALQPGISRLATTYAAGCWLGLGAYTALEVSLLVQLPLIGAAWLVSLIKIYLRGMVAHVITVPMLAVVFASSVVAFLLLWWVARCAYAGKLWKLSWYMIVPLLASLMVH